MSRRVLLIPVEAAQRRGLELPGNPDEWEQMKCPICPRMCWVHSQTARRLRTGELTGICTLCALGESVSLRFARMLRGHK